MRNIYDTAIHIAEKFAGSGKVLTSEARVLAREYLNALREIRSLNQKIANLLGGEIVTLRGKELIGKELRVWAYRDRRGQIAPTLAVHRINDAIKRMVTVVELYGSESVTGPKKTVESYFELNALVSQAIQEAYDAGLKDGSNLLMGLAGGDVSINDFNAEVNGGKRGR